MFWVAPYSSAINLMSRLAIFSPAFLLSAPRSHYVLRVSYLDLRDAAFHSCMDAIGAFYKVEWRTRPHTVGFMESECRFGLQQQMLT